MKCADRQCSAIGWLLLLAKRQALSQDVTQVSLSRQLRVSAALIVSSRTVSARLLPPWQIVQTAVK